MHIDYLSNISLLENKILQEKNIKASQNDM